MTIIVLWILLSIIALIVVLLHFSVYAHIKVDTNGSEVKVKYLFFSIYPRKSKNKKINRTKERKAKKSNEFSDNLDDEFNDNNSLEKSAGNIEQETEEILTDKQKTEKLSLDSVSDNKKASDSVKKSVKKKFKNKKDKSKKEKKQKGGKLSGLKGKYNKIKPYLPMGWKYFKKLLKTIRITGVKIEINVGREDAHQAAIYYGAVQAALFNLLGHICNIFTVKIEKANVNCIFVKNTINGSGECYIRVRPSAVIATAFCIGINFLIIFFRQKRIKKKSFPNVIENSDNKILEV